MRNTLRPYILASFLGFVSALLACVDTFSDPALEKTKQEKLIVDGVITTELKKFSVTLSLSTAILGKRTLDIIPDAKVKVVDDLQNQFDLLHTEFGIYETKTEQRAVVGRSYKIVIDLPNGKRYESIPELVKSVPKIDSLRTPFVEKRSPNGYKIPSFEVIAEIQDSPTKGDYYRWNWVNYKYLVSCRDSVNNQFKIFYRIDCCEPCWAIKRSDGEIILSEDLYFNGKKINQPIMNVPYNSRRPYYIEVTLYSMTETAHKYWKTIKAQISNVGGIFDNPPATIQGNIRNINNSEEQVLGFFGASAVTRKNTYVQRSLGPYPPVIGQLAKPTVVIVKECIPCDEKYSRTNKKPTDWKDEFSTIFYDELLEF
jgi:hypothetical protein